MDKACTFDEGPSQRKRRNTQNLADGFEYGQDVPLLDYAEGDADMTFLDHHDLSSSNNDDNEEEGLGGLVPTLKFG